MTNLLIAHRGSMDLYPENTMLSFRKAIEEGARGIELDARAVRSGEIIVLHDDTLERTTDGTGDVRDLDWDYISGLDAGIKKGVEFANREDTKIPLLTEVLDEFMGKPVFISIHLKFYTILKYYEVVDMVKTRDMLGQVLFFGYSGSIGKIKEYEEKAFIMNDGFGAHTDFEGTLTQAVTENWNAISIYDQAITKEMVDTIHSHDILTQVSSLSGNYANETQRMIDMGVDIILANNPLAMMPTLNNNYVNQIVPPFYKVTPENPDVPPLESTGDFELRVYNGSEWIESTMSVKIF